MSSDYLDLAATLVDFTAPVHEATEVVINALGVGKCYQLYEKPSHRLLQSLLGDSRRFYKEFWALRAIDFQIRRGETIGIIGRNGSGKSTLLQLVAGTLTPTEGTVECNGRVAALLELGSGFNPDFTGRENVYLNAAILGMARDEVNARLDAILSFADIGEFIDQPVRSYSTGMVMRLAFSVMAHVDADVLIIDEALAVGDAFFVQKCMRFLRAFREKGTLLFVSHDAGAVTALCDRALWIDHGHLHAIGNAKEVMAAYSEMLIAERQGGSVASLPRTSALVPVQQRKPDPRSELLSQSNLRNDIEVPLFNPDQAGFGEGKVRVDDVAILDALGTAISQIVGGELVTLEVTGHAEQDVDNLIVGFYIKDRLGQLLFGDNTFLSHSLDKAYSLRAGEVFRARFTFEMPRLLAGDYFITLGVAEGSQEKHVMQHWLHEALPLKSLVDPKYPSGLIGLPMQDIALERL